MKDVMDIHADLVKKTGYICKEVNLAFADDEVRIHDYFLEAKNIEEVDIVEFVNSKGEIVESITTMQVHIRIKH